MALVELHDTKYDKLDVYEFMARYSNLSIAVGRFLIIPLLESRVSWFHIQAWLY